MFGSVVMFSVMAGFVKVLPHISSTVVAFYRFAIGLGLLGLLALVKIIKLRFNNFKILFLRGLSGGLAVFVLYLSIVKLGIGKASVYSYSYPMFSSILSVFFFKEKIPKGKWLLIFLAFIGIIILSLDFTGNTGVIRSSFYYEVLAIAGAVCAGFSIIFVKKLHDTDDSYAIFFSQTIVGFWIFLIPGIAAEYSASINEGLILLIIGVLAMTGQLLMTEGYKYTTVTTGSSFALLVPVFNTIIGIVFFKEVFTIPELAGSILVILCCLLIITYNRFILFIERKVLKR